jgi:hypothetical protein
VNTLSIGLGLALGLGTVLVARGLRRLTDKALDPDVRRKGYWALNAGLALIAGSIIAFSRLSAG